jgi:hypothetical protein
MSDALFKVCRASNELLLVNRAEGVSAQEITDVIAPIINGLERERADMLAALELALDVIEATGPDAYPEAEKQIREAISKAKESS